MSKSGSNNEIDSLEAFFSDKLKDASVQPSEKVWQQIEGSLNQDKKRRRGFIWLIFCGLFFIGAGISTYVVMMDKKDLTTTKTALKELLPVTENKKITTNENEKSVLKTEEKENTTAEIAKKEEAPNTIHIQLGAFKKQIDKSIFNKTGLDIKSETNEVGVTRYYAEVPENKKQEALQKVQQAGFADAFVKKNNNLLAAKNSETKNIIEITKAPEHRANLLGLKNSETKHAAKTAELTENKLDLVAATKTESKTKIHNTNSTEAKIKNTDVSLGQTTNESKNEEEKGNATTNRADETKLTKTNEVAATNIINTDAIPPEETKTEPVAAKQTDADIKTDTAIIAIVNKTDSVKTEDKKKDEPVVAKANVDTIPPEKTSRWAFLLTGGPNFFLKNTQNSLVNTSAETQPTTYNGSVKVEYRLLKNIAVSLGFNYSYFTAKQDATLFYFNKNQTTDYIFYSSYGPMAVGMSTMLQDFSPIAPVTIFHASYSYTSKLNTLLVPLEAKWYFINNKRINLYTALGASAQFILSEQTNLSVIKEHLTNYINYNQVNTNKFNTILMLGLGGDVRLYKKLYFTVDGGFRYGVNNISNTSGIKTNLTYFSVNGGLKIKL